MKTTTVKNEGSVKSAPASRNRGKKTEPGKSGASPSAAKRGPRKPKRSAKGQADARRRRLMKAVLVAAAAAALWLGWLFIQISSYKPLSPVPRADAALVLGAALWNDRPSPGLEERLDGALRLYEMGKVGRIIVSGGRDQNGSTLTEAEGMRRYLIANKVPDERILLENKATSTYENILFSSAVADMHKIESVIIVTHEYHAARAEDIADFLHDRPYSVYGVKSKVLSAAYHESRETLAFAKWKLDELLMLIGLRDTQGA